MKRTNHIERRIATIGMRQHAHLAKNPSFQGFDEKLCPNKDRLR